MALRGHRIWGGSPQLILALCNWKKSRPCAHTWGRGEQWGWGDISSWVRPQNLSVPAINVSEPHDLKGSGRWLGAGYRDLWVRVPRIYNRLHYRPVLGYWGHWGGKLGPTGVLDPDGNNWDHCGVM